MRDEHTIAREVAEARPHLLQAGRVAQVGLRVTVDLAGPSGDRNLGTHQGTEGVDDLAVAHFCGTQFDDLAGRRIQIGGLEVEGHVVAQQVAELAAVDELQCLEQGGGARPPALRLRWQDQVVVTW